MSNTTHGVSPTLFFRWKMKYALAPVREHVHIAELQRVLQQWWTYHEGCDTCGGEWRDVPDGAGDDPPRVQDSHRHP